MRLALRLAAQGEGLVEPNPMVGCVLVRDGERIGQGFHRRFGGPHAEVEALRDCHDPRGATAYVTLEPCCHHGKTPPCTEALLRAGVGRVVVAVEDPFPSVAGGGIRQLRISGVDVTVGVLASEARDLIAPYLKRVATGRPWVIAKWAMTLDGKIATVTGQSQWITGDASRREVHRLRGRVDAIAVGMGTVEADDPRLTARTVDASGQAVTPPRVANRVVFCSHRTPRPTSRVVRSARQTPLTLVAGPHLDEPRLQELGRLGVSVWRCPASSPTAMVEEALRRSASPNALVTDLSIPGTPVAEEAVPAESRVPATNWMLEGGGGLIASFFEAGQVDECHVYVGPMVFGGLTAAGPVGGSGVSRLADAGRYRLLRTDRFDDDVRLVFRRTTAD